MTDKYQMPCSMSEKEQWEVAHALIEQYGEYVGNYLISSIRHYMETKDHQKVADMMVLSERIDALNGGRTVVQRDPPDRPFSH